MATAAWARPWPQEHDKILVTRGNWVQQTCGIFTTCVRYHYRSVSAVSYLLAELSKSSVAAAPLKKKLAPDSPSLNNKQIFGVSGIFNVSLVLVFEILGLFLERFQRVWDHFGSVLVIFERI